MEFQKTFALCKGTLVNLTTVERIELVEKKIVFKKFLDQHTKILATWEYQDEESAKNDFDSLVNHVAYFLANDDSEPGKRKFQVW